MKKKFDTTKRKGKSPSRRVCSTCEGTGHNRRTCPVSKAKPAEQAVGAASKTAQEAATGTKIVMWKVADLKLHPANEDMPRLDGPSLERLRADVAARGVDDPLHIVLDEDGKTGLIIAGRERFEAAKAAAKVQVPVIIRHDLVSDRAKLRIHVVLSNVDRKKLTEGQLVRALLPHEDHLLQERKLKNGGEGRAETGPDTQRISQIMAELVGFSATKWKEASSLVRAHEAGEAPIVKLYIDGLIRAHRAKEALRLPISEQNDIVTEMKEHTDSPIDDRRTVARHLLDEAMRELTDEVVQEDAHQENAEEEETPAPAKSVGTMSRGAKSKVIQFPRDQVHDDSADLEQAEGVEAIEESESGEDGNGVEPEEEVSGSSTPEDDFDIKPEATTAASPPEPSPIDEVLAALDDVYELILNHTEQCPELYATLDGLSKLIDELSGAVAE